MGPRVNPPSIAEGELFAFKPLADAVLSMPAAQRAAVVCPVSDTKLSHRARQES
jgi:hypothetical protein